MATLSEPWKQCQTPLGSIPVRLQQLPHLTVILFDAGDRTIWRIILEGRLEAVRPGCRVSVSMGASENLIAEHTQASGTRIRPAPPHIAARVPPADRSAKS